MTRASGDRRLGASPILLIPACDLLPEIRAVLKENEVGARVDELCRRHGISTATFYAWRKKFGGMEASDAKKLRELEVENARLKRIVADQMLDMTAMKELLAKNW